MSLEKAIKHGKEHRKPYYGSGKFDRTCRCHGSCPYCRNNRFVGIKRLDIKTADEIAEVLDNVDIPVQNIKIHRIGKQ